MGQKKKDTMHCNGTDQTTRRCGEIVVLSCYIWLFISRVTLGFIDDVVAHKEFLSEKDKQKHTWSPFSGTKSLSTSETWTKCSAEDPPRLRSHSPLSGCVYVDYFVISGCVCWIIVITDDLGLHIGLVWLLMISGCLYVRFMHICQIKVRIKVSGCVCRIHVITADLRLWDGWHWQWFWRCPAQWKWWLSEMGIILVIEKVMVFFIWDKMAIMLYQPNSFHIC